jgi:hypothetical protein
VTYRTPAEPPQPERRTPEEVYTLRPGPGAALTSGVLGLLFAVAFFGSLWLTSERHRLDCVRSAHGPARCTIIRSTLFGATRDPLPPLAPDVRAVATMGGHAWDERVELRTGEGATLAVVTRQATRNCGEAVAAINQFLTTPASRRA